jgi:hypothetical protein
MIVPGDHFPQEWIGLDQARVQSIISVARSPKRCPITWVSSYFNVPSKRDHMQYMSWLDNLFSMRMCLVIFTDNEEVTQKAFGSTAKPVVIHVDLQREASLRLNMSTQFWETQFRLDPEQGIHQSYKLYWVWALKSFFLADTLQMESKLGFGSDYFVWIDAGLMRDDMYKNKDITAVIPGMNTHQVYFGLVEQWQETFPNSTDWCSGPSFVHSNRLMGGIFGGHKSVILNWLDVFKEATARYVECGWFIGKDQSIMNSACLRFGGLCHYIRSSEADKDPWHVLKYHILGPSNA